MFVGVCVCVRARVWVCAGVCVCVWLCECVLRGRGAVNGVSTTVVLGTDWPLAGLARASHEFFALGLTSLAKNSIIKVMAILPFDTTNLRCKGSS